MKNRLLTLAGALALAAVVGKFYAVPAIAQVRAAVVKNLDEKGRNPYYQTQNCFSSSTNQCTVAFPVVPPNKRLVVEFIASSVDTPTALQTVEFAANGNFIPILHTQQGNDSSGNKIYVANQPMLYYYEPGQVPYLAMSAATAGFEFMSGQVTLTGYLVDLTQ
jgi:hypothetical protein